MKLFLSFIIILLLKTCYDIYYYFLTTKYRKDYWRYLEEDLNKSFILEKKNRIIKCLKKAGVKDVEYGDITPAGYGMLATYRLSVMDNIALKDKNIVARLTTMFDEAVGEYRHRIIDTINPIFWLEAVIFLPQKILTYLGMNTDSVFTKIFQLIYWIGTVLVWLFNDQLRSYLLDFLSSLFK